MDAGIGIGGLNHENEEYSHSKFDLFGSTEYEVGVLTLVVYIILLNKNTDNKLGLIWAKL